MLLCIAFSVEVYCELFAMRILASWKEGGIIDVEVSVLKATGMQGLQKVTTFCSLHFV